MGSEQRKRSGKIFGGSALNVDGQGIYSLKVIPPTFDKKTRKPTFDNILPVTTTTTTIIPPTTTTTTTVFSCNLETQQYENLITQDGDNLVFCD